MRYLLLVAVAACTFASGCAPPSAQPLVASEPSNQSIDTALTCAQLLERIHADDKRAVGSGIIWLDQKHGIRSRRQWRKLHFGMDANAHEIGAVELTPDDVGDVTEFPNLLDQIDANVASMTADGAYDGEAVYNGVCERHPEASIIIPPRTTAVAGDTTATQRDLHIATIEEHRRMGWQRRSRDNRRNLVESAMFRYKTIIDRRLNARTLPNQQTEAKVGGSVSDCAIEVNWVTRH